MAISDNYVPLRQIGNGVTVDFSGSWNMIAAAYALVYLEDAVTGVQTAVPAGAGPGKYTLVFNASGFTVTYGTPPSASQYAVVARSVALTQTDPYRTSKGYQGEVLEASLDKLTAMIQDTTEINGRAIVAPLGDTAASLVLPAVAGRALKYVAFDASGNVIATAGTGTSTPISSAMAPVVSSITLAAARTAMGVPTASMPAHTFYGNNTGATADGINLTQAQLTAELNAFVGDSGSGGTQGVVPAPASGDAAAGKFLKADGTWKSLGITLMAVRTPGAVTTDTQTGIPSTAKRITISFIGLTKGGTGDVNIRVGPLAGVVSAGYVGVSRGTNISAGMAVGTSWSGVGALCGTVIMNLVDATNNIWAWEGIPSGSGFGITMGGYISLGSGNPLERIMITDQGGAPGNFSAGSWQVSYE